MQAAIKIGGTYALYAHGRSQRSMQEPATIEDVHDVLCSPQQRKSSQRITQSTPKRRSVKKRKGPQIENVDKRSKSEAVSIAEDIRTLWIEKKIDKSEIGLRLFRKTVGPDGKQYKNGKKLVQKIVQLLVETPTVAPYSTIRGWINAARKATALYGDCVEKKFFIKMKCGAPPLADSATLLRYIDSDTLNQKAGNFKDLKQFLTKQLAEQHSRRGLQVCDH